MSYSAKNATVVAADALFAEEMQSLKNRGTSNHERRSYNASPNEIRPIKKIMNVLTPQCISPNLTTLSRAMSAQATHSPFFHVFKFRPLFVRPFIGRSFLVLSKLLLIPSTSF